MAETIQLTKQQQRLLKLVYKFRFVNTPSLAQFLGFRRYSVYQVVELLREKELLAKVYEQSWRIDRRPAYYYLSKKGVTTVRKLLELPDSAVNSIYQDHRASPEFIQDCLTTLSCYNAIKQQLSDDTVIRTKTEINRFDIFPKHRPDIYVKAPNGQEAFVIIMPDKLPYFVNNRLDEYIEHSEEEGWSGEYPILAFVLKDSRRKTGFLHKTRSKLESLGIEESDFTVVSTGLENLLSGNSNVWGSAFIPQHSTTLFK